MPGLVLKLDRNEVAALRAALRVAIEDEGTLADFEIEQMKSLAARVNHELAEQLRRAGVKD